MGDGIVAWKMTPRLMEKPVESNTRRGVEGLSRTCSRKRHASGFPPKLRAAGQGDTGRGKDAGQSVLEAASAASD